MERSGKIDSDGRGMIYPQRPCGFFLEARDQLFSRRKKVIDLGPVVGLLVNRLQWVVQ